MRQVFWGIAIIVCMSSAPGLSASALEYVPASNLFFDDGSQAISSKGIVESLGDVKTTSPTATILITSFPPVIEPNTSFDVTAEYTSNFAQTGHRGRVYLDVVNAGDDLVIEHLYKDNNGEGYTGASGAVTFTTSVPDTYNSVYFRVYIAPMEMKPWIVSEYMSYPQDGSYPYKWSGNGVTHDIFYKSSLIISDNVEGNYCYCCGITYQAFMDAYEKYNTAYAFDSIAGMSVSQMTNFRRDWYVATGGIGDKGAIKGIVNYGVGFEITNWEEVLDGDIVQIWRQSDSGHSVIFREWVRDLEENIIGFTYWSTQPSTSGIGFNTEYFGESSGMDPTRTYFARVVKPSDADDWKNRYASDNTSGSPTAVGTPTPTPTATPTPTPTVTPTPTPTPTPVPGIPPIAHYSFEFNEEGWSFNGEVPPYHEPTTTWEPGRLGLNADTSSYSFSYWLSPEIPIEDDKIYQVIWLVSSSVSEPDSSLQFRLRINQPGSWQGWERIVNSYNQHAPSDISPLWYQVLFNPAVTDEVDDTIQLSFDLLSFDDADDTSSWIYLEEAIVQEVLLAP